MDRNIKNHILSEVLLVKNTYALAPIVPAEVAGTLHILQIQKMIVKQPLALP